MSDDEEQYNSKAHKGLLQAISSLGKVQHIRKSTRSEPQQQQDEFQLAKGGTSVSTDVHARAQGVGVNDIVQILKTTKTHLAAGKQLKNVKTTKKVLKKPLEKPAADRIKRTIGYEKAKKQLQRWDAVVAQNRTAGTQVFPLKSETIFVDTAAYSKPLKLSLKSDLMLEMEATDAKLKALRKERVGDMEDEQELATREQELLRKKLTRDELIARRKELTYLKMRESQKSAKARQRNKIKSKKYHKLLKRQKIQVQLKEFELLQKTNPEAALEKLDALEKNRVLERASLRHKNTGTWAKNLQVRAKYDKDVRKDLSEQLQMSRQLTQKKEEDDRDADDEEQLQKVKLEQQQQEDETYDPFNPWTRAGTAKGEQNRDAGQDKENWRKYWLERNENEKKLMEYRLENEGDVEHSMNEMEKEDSEIDEMAASGSELKKTKSKVNEIVAKAKHKIVVENDDVKMDIVPKMQKIQSQTKTKVKAEKPIKKPQIENGWLVEEIKKPENKHEINIDDIFDAQEDKNRERLSKKLELLAKQAKRLNTTKGKKKLPKVGKDALKNLKDLTFKNEFKRPVIDEELNNEELNSQENKRKALDNTLAATRAITSSTQLERGAKQITHSSHVSDTIDPNKLATVKLKQPINNMELMNDSLADIAMDEIDEHPEVARQMTISEAFEDDDIIADFTKDKTKDTELKNTEIELSMPGWGSWAGAGLSKEYGRRNKRFVLNLEDKLAAEKAKRRDENKGGVYINEDANKLLRTHLVSDVPFPFTSLQDYEASIRAPVGRNFVPETAFRMLTRPAVITQKGKIIEPMEESELVKPARPLRHVIDARIKRAAKATKGVK